MHSHTPAPPRMRSRRIRPNRVIIATQGEDYPDEAPTVMGAGLEELGIEPDSLALGASRAGKILRDAQPPRRPAVRRSGPLRVEPPAPAPRVAPPSSHRRPVSPDELRKERHIQLLSIIAVAAVPVLLALLAALWLTAS